MDKARMHEKQPEVGSRASKPEDFKQWHGNMFKRSGHESDFFAQPYLPAMPLPYPLPMWSHPLFPNFLPTPMPQHPVPPPEQESSEEGHQQGGTQTCASDRSESPETPGPNVGAGRNSCQAASSEPNHEAPHMGGARVPYNFSGGFVFPAPYAGQPDPLMVWMHHMQRQVAYLYSMSGCRNGYQRPTPIPSNGTNQRGYIKIPAGIPQKQSRLWETQSAENMQLWATVTQLCATVARAEAEIFGQRGKISKLEDDLQMMKARQDAMSEALKNMTTVSPPIKRARRKRTATAPVAILGLPASQPLPEKLQVKKARGLVSESDTLKASNYPALEGRSKGTELNGTLECMNRPAPDGTGNCLTSTVDLEKKESQSDLQSKDILERQLANTASACVVPVVPREENQDLHLTGGSPGEIMKETAGPQSVEIKQERSTMICEVGRCNEEQVAGEHAVRSGTCNMDCGVMRRGEPLVIENRVDQAISGDCNKNIGLIRLMSKDDWLEGMEEGRMDGGLLHASSVVESPDGSDDGNQTLRAGESLLLKSSEQQKGEVKAIKGTSPDELTVTKLSDYIVLYPESSVFKEPMM